MRRCSCCGQFLGRYIIIMPFGRTHKLYCHRCGPKVNGGRIQREAQVYLNRLAKRLKIMDAFDFGDGCDDDCDFDPKDGPEYQKLMSQFPLPPCGNRECCASTGIHDGMTFGSGKLDYHGYWEHPCEVCARAFEKKHPEYAPCWPFEDEVS